MAPARAGASSSSEEGSSGGGERGPQLRRLLVMCLLAATSVAWVTASNRLVIEVDGRTVSLRSYADTVGDALLEAGVEVTAHDLVVPGRDAPVVDGLEVEVSRAVPVALKVDGRVTQLSVVGDTVQDVLVAAGIDDVQDLSVHPAPSTALAGVREVHVVASVTAHVRADGDTHVVRLRRGTVADALELADVSVGADDEVSHPPDTPLRVDMSTITVTRRDHEEVVEQVRLPFHEEVVHTDDLFDDEQVVVQEGAEGRREDTYRLTRVDGQVVDRALVSQEVTTAPVDRVVHVGTAPRPAPPPPAPAPPPEPAPPPPSAPADSDDDSVWDRLAQCESHGNWAAQGHYHGGLQFHPDTWDGWKPQGYPAYAYEASREQQIEVGRRLHSARGWSPWPHCAEELGLQ